MVAIIGLLSTGNVLAGEQSISGTVEKGAQGIMISTDDGQSYAVQGKDLSDIVGKTVKATGTLEEGKSGNTINVTMVEEVKEMKE